MYLGRGQEPRETGRATQGTRRMWVGCDLDSCLMGSPAGLNRGVAVTD